MIRARVTRAIAAMALLTCVACAAENDAGPAENGGVEAMIWERSGKTSADHDEFAPFALHDRDGDGKLSKQEQAEAARAGLDVVRLGDRHKGE